MTFFKKIILLYALCHVAASSQTADLSGGQSTTWNQVPHKLLNDIVAGENGHSLAYLKINEAMDDRAYTHDLSVETHTFDGKVNTKTCNIDSSIGEHNDGNVERRVLLLRDDRVLVSWKERVKGEDPRTQVCVIKMDSCESSEPLIFGSEILTVPFKDHFDVLVTNEKRCPGKDYCKMSHDLDGKPIDNAPVPLKKPYLEDNESMVISHAYTINYSGKEGMVLTGKKNGQGSAGPEVYSPISGWIKMDELAHIQNKYSNTSGLASICWFSKYNDQIDCKWLDNAHANGQVLNVKLEKEMTALPTIHNTADGHILFMKNGNQGKKLLVDKIQSDGKCSRILEIDTPDRPRKVRLSITNKNQYCFSVIFAKNQDPPAKDDAMTHTLTTKCVQMPETIVEDAAIQCGKDYDAQSL